MKNSKTNKLIDAGCMVIAVALSIGFIYLVYKGFRGYGLKGLCINLGLNLVVIFIFILVSFIGAFLIEWVSRIKFKNKKLIIIQKDTLEWFMSIFWSFLYIIPLISPLYIYIIGDTILATIASILILFITCFYLFTHFVVTQTTLWKLKIQLRKATKKLYYLLTFGILIAMYFRIGTTNDIYIRSDINFDLKNLFLWFYTRSWDILLLMFLYNIVTDDNNSNKYVLFLRPFGYDKNLDDYECLQKIRSAVSNNIILRVGNPNTLFSFRIGVETYFLPTIDWKSELKELIEHSKQVVIVLGSSEGVLWEVFNNIEHADKYIYYIDNTDDLKYILDSKYCYDFKETFIVKFLSSLSSMNIEDISPDKHCAFTIFDGSVYFSNDISKIIRLKRKTIGTEEIRQWQDHNDYL